MKTSLYTAYVVFLSLLFTLCPKALSYVFQGYYSLIATDTTTSCSSSFTVNVDTTTKTAAIFQTLNSSASCSQRNLELSSFFIKDMIGSAPYLIPDTIYTMVPYWYATFDMNNIPSLNGTACVSLPQTKTPNYFYLCSFVSDGLSFYVEMFSSSSTWIQPVNFSNPMVPFFNGNTQEMNVLQANSAFNPPTMDLYQSCDLDTTINSLDNYIFLLVPKNTLTMFNGMSISYVLLRSKTAYEGYRSYSVKSSNTAYSQWDDSSITCTNTNIKFTQILDSSSSFCKNGCDLSFLLTNDQNSEIYVMQTTGIVYVPYTSASSTSSGGNSGLDESTMMGLTVGLPLGLAFCIIFTAACCANCRNRTRADEFKVPQVEQPPIPVANTDQINIVTNNNNNLSKVMTSPVDSNPTLTTLVNPQDIALKVQPVPNLPPRPPMNYAPPPPGNESEDWEDEKEESEEEKRSEEEESDGEDSPIMAQRNKQPAPIPEGEGGPRLAPALSGSGKLNTRPKPTVIHPCVVCNSQLADTIFGPCNHIVCCRNCDYKLMVCPSCNMTIENKLYVFHPTPEDYKRVLSEAVYDKLQRRGDEKKNPLPAFVCFSCQKKNINTVAIPCGHMFGCKNCMNNINKCMICSAVITSKRFAKFK